MLNEPKKYLSAAKAAADLALSTVTIKKLVTLGELDGERSEGGHWQISISSLDEYRKIHNYKERPKKGKICILHRGTDLDPLLLQGPHPRAIQVMFHRWELVDIDPYTGVLFIDARHLRIQATPLEMLEGLQKKYRLVVYNSQVLPEGSPFLEIGGVVFVPSMINAQFISGYEVAKQLKQNRRTWYRAGPGRPSIE